MVPEAGAAPRARRLSAEAAALWQRFPPRAVAASWPASQAGRCVAASQAMACPYAAAENDQSRYFRRPGIIRMLDWLETQPGATWQDRWQVGCRSAADQDWRDIAELHLKDTGRIAAGNWSVWRSLGGALGLLIGCDVIRPDLGWLLTSASPAHLAADMARVRDPHGFAALEGRRAGVVSVASTRRAMLQVAVMMAVKGGMAGDITVGDCLELLETRAFGSWATGITGERTSTSCCTQRASSRRAPRPGQGCSTRAFTARRAPGSWSTATGWPAARSGTCWSTT